jgi:hypothetical protein
MILAAARAALEPYLLTIRVVLSVAIVIATAFAGWRITVWHDSHKRVKATEKALAKSVASLQQCTDSQTAAALAYAGAVLQAETVAAADRVTAERIENELQTKLVAADAGARDLARRLRDHQARRCSSAVPLVAGSAAQPAGAATEPGDGEAVDRATSDHLAACALDSEELAGWLAWWTGIKAGRADQTPR